MNWTFSKSLPCWRGVLDAEKSCGAEYQATKRRIEICGIWSSKMEESSFESKECSGYLGKIEWTYSMDLI